MITIYVAGGHVRDTLLGNKPIDMDFVVCGATESAFHTFGEHNDFQFKKVGFDFPVYLDQYGREWAFARKERKTGPGYKGFDCEFDPTVTIEEDLFRRDLTCNSMAVEVIGFYENGEAILGNHIIDPHNGQDDLEDRVLCHTSKHFVEDPVRVLRVARFCARYNFDVHTSTVDLIQNMCDIGELDHLVPERVWAEVEKAMKEPFSRFFFDTLMETDAADIIFPGLREVWNNDTARVLNISDDVFEKAAIVTHEMDPDDVHQFWLRIKAPINVINFAVKFAKMMRYLEVIDFNLNRRLDDSVFILDILKDLDVFRDKSFFPRALGTVFNFAENEEYSEAVQQLAFCYSAALEVTYDDLSVQEQTTLKGIDIGKAIDRKRQVKIKDALCG